MYAIRIGKGKQSDVTMSDFNRVKKWSAEQRKKIEKPQCKQITVDNVSELYSFV